MNALEHSQTAEAYFHFLKVNHFRNYLKDVALHELDDAEFKRLIQEVRHAELNRKGLRSWYTTKCHKKFAPDALKRVQSINRQGPVAPAIESDAK